MTGPYSECPIRLHRDALNTPWGFRLQGGKDFKAPLSVQRVFVGSPADGELHRGDVLVAIDNNDTNYLTHKQAQDVIKNAGGSLSLRIKRGGHVVQSSPITFGTPGLTSPAHPATASYRSRPLDSITPKPAPPIGAFSPKTSTGPAMQYPGIDYHHHGAPPAPHGMLQRVNQSLTDSLWTPDNNQDAEYQHKSMGEIKQIFSQGGPQRHGAAYGQTGGSYQPSCRQPWRKPNVDGSAPKDPGWVAAPQRANYTPVHAPSPVSINQPDQHHHQVHRQQPPIRDVMGRPAWSGSLRSSGGPKPWEVAAGEHLVPGGIDAHIATGPSAVPRQAPQSTTFQPQLNQQPNVQPHNPRVQNTHYGGDGDQYQQLSSYAADSDSARVVHSQYNSPLGLYSKDNAQAALSGQTHGKPGDGTMQVIGGDGKKKFNPAQSDVYRLLQEEQEIVQHHQDQNQHQHQHQHQGQPHGQHQSHDQSARYQDHHPGQEMHYQGYMDHSTKSPSMMALEAQVLDEGTSDF